MKNLILVVSLLFFVACTESMNTPEKRYIYFENGKTRREYQVINDKKEGAMVDFYPDGKKKSDRLFKNDIQIGKTTIYHPNGNVKEVQYYDNNGQREKGDTLWYENGTLEYVAQFSNNMKNGLITKFDSSQKTIYRAVFKNDSLVQVLNN
jgi:antitoxin component YwqK of YwqJK toxin-antitoxin module